MDNLDPNGNIDLNFDGEVSVKDMNEELHIPVKVEEKNCEQRIRASLDYREKEFDAYFKSYDDYEFDEDDEDDVEILKYINDNEIDAQSIFQADYGMTKKVVIKIEFSGGGPADYLKVTMDEDGEVIERVDYFFVDWYDYAERKVDEDSPLYRYAEFKLSY